MHALLIQSIALVGGTVHSMELQPSDTGPRLVAPAVATVWIQDGLIAGVGPDLDLPEGTKEIDVAGLHVVPGLVDGAVTFDKEHDALYLAAGVTTVRDNGSPIAGMIPESAAAMRDRVPGPSLLIASPVFASSGTSRGDGFVLGDPASAGRQIEEVLELLEKARARVDYFAIDRVIGADVHSVVCGAARSYGVEVWGPLPMGIAPARARGHGQRSLVGLDSLLPRGQRFDTLENLDLLEGTVASLGSDGWRVAPLLMGTARIPRLMAEDGEPVVIEALGGAYEMAWRTDIETFALIEASGGTDAVNRSIAHQRELVASMHAAGVQLVPASGAPSGGIAPGNGLVDELEEWSVAGIPPAEILHLATARAADALGATDRGRIRKGMVADMIVLGSDPLRSVTALRDPELVVVRGQVLERFQLEERVAALVERQAQVRADRERPIALERAPMPAGDVLLDGAASLVNYGVRTAIERYTVVQMADGRRAYGARVRILPTEGAPARELVVVQIIERRLVQQFDLTLDVLDDDGNPLLGEEGEHSFLARGRPIEGLAKLTIERFRGKTRIDAQRADEAIAAIDGSSVSIGLIAALEFPEGASFIAGFDGLMMEPLVDRTTLQVSRADGRLEMTDTRGARVFGLAANGRLLFGARAQAGGRLDIEPAELIDLEPIHALTLPAERTFTGDPERWAETALEMSAKRGEPSENDR